MSFTIDTLTKLNRFLSLLALQDSDCLGKTNVIVKGKKWLRQLDINRFQRLSVALGQCPALKVLGLKSNNLAALNFERFYLVTTAITNCKTLQHLDLSSNNLGNLDAAHFEIFCAVLGQCESLQRIDLSDNALGKLETKEFQMLITCLYKCKMSLDIKGIESNEFNVDQKIIFKDVLDYHCDNVFQPLRMSLSKMSAQHLDLSSNNLGNLDAAHFKIFCAVLGQCNLLQSIDLSDNALGKLETKEFQMLITCLYKCKMLLDIQGIESNKFSPDQKIILKDVLNHHCNNVFQPLRMSLSKMSADSEEERSDHEKPRQRRLKRN